MENRFLKYALLSLTILTPAWADQHHAETISFKTVPVTDNIQMLQGKGGNIGVLNGAQGILMIDDDYKVMTPALITELKKYGGQDKLTYLINTHWHGDHTEGNLQLGKGTQIIAHDNVRKRLLTSQEIKLFNMVSEPYPEYALPSLTYQQRLTLHMNGETLEIVHYPNGHTDGDSVVFFKNANVVHMGDHFFSGFYPFVDVGSGGNVLNMAENIRAIMKRINPETKIIPGHGPLSSITELQAFHDMLIGTSAEVAAMKEQGLNLEAIEKQGLSEKWNEWADGFLPTKVWIGILYSSLEKG